MPITIIILVLAVFFFINGKVRADIVALCALIFLMTFKILTPTEALSGFSSSIVIMMVGLFIVGGGIFQTGLASMIGSKLMAFAGNSELKLFIFVMLTTAGIGAFVSNTGTVAIMLPIVVSMATNAGINSRRLLMPLAFASSMGGMLTLIGTPPNLVISETLVEKGHEGLSFFSFLPVGLICVTLGVVILVPFSKIFLSTRKDDKSKGKKKGKSLKQLAGEYQLSDNLYRVRVKTNSSLSNRQIGELGIVQKYNINILEIRRRPTTKKPFAKTVNQIISGPVTIIENNDILYVMGSFEDVKTFIDANGLEWVDKQETEDIAPSFSGKLRFDEIGIAELVIMSNSKLINTKVRNAGFREKYNVNILGIQRSKQYILQNLKDEKIHAGDALLIQGEWQNISRLSEEPAAEWVVVGQPLAEASKITLDHKAPLAALILVVMVACMISNIIPTVTAVLAAAVLMILTGCLRSVEAAYQTINWESIVLIGAMLPMSLALENTGISSIVANAIVKELGSIGPTAMLAGIYLATSILTLFISNTATAVLFAPIAYKAAITFGVSPLPFLFAVTVAASMCFASPFSTPPNALVMSAGRYSFMDYVRIGGPLQIIYGIVMILVLPLLFPYY